MVISALRLICFKTTTVQWEATVTKNKPDTVNLTLDSEQRIMLPRSEKFKHLNASLIMRLIGLIIIERLTIVFTNSIQRHL